MNTDRTDEDLLRSGLILTHGLPGAGKSEWAQDLAVRYPDRVVHLNHNEIRLRRFGDTQETGFFKKHEAEINQIKDSLMEKAWSEGKTVILSDPNLKDHELAPIANKARDRGLTVGQKYFEMSLEDSLRNNHRKLFDGGFHLNERAIENMAKSAFGRDGRLKEFRIGVKSAFAYDRAGSDDERFVKDFNKRQQEKFPVRSKQLANFDLDGTLVSTEVLSDRHMWKERDFHSFHTESEFAPPNEAVVRDARKAYEAGLTVSVTTARLEQYSGATTRWIERIGVPVSILKMRHEGDSRPDHDAKVDMIAEFREEGFEIVHSWDDNQQAIAAFEEANIRVTKIPYHEPSDPSLAPTTYDPVSFESPFNSGICLKCGRSFQGPGVLGPKCRVK